ncbi:uncharacterized protein LOC107264849 isoform X2 [Cephus cinctus]|uniref:Uncharacterized protein LOC107264849 isoform X2 n=1 Tax=Cephus cinctus TaxID=211228 RepID=A0AAJ7FFE0_CEPCN|nr:uncharacterized protein LOC107264849 isoform X2 [Cephus cinctus]XP_015589095.1 uncharacterized protein LOC107264849 isoform X2 [Cephus cinctus]XP_015589101.1 uncharacterized protein LOC107264849 isoform X2 [Cephus cinctus]
MTRSGIWTSLIMLILLFENLEAVTVVNHHPDDEFILDHQVLYEDAIREAKKLKIFPAPIPGCNPCTSEEMDYCKNGKVIEDHCCCDGSYYKVFPFVEHICRVGPEACNVHAGDCSEYSRLRECCCSPYLASVWKYRAGGANSVRTNHWHILTIPMFLTILREIPRLLGLS